VGIILYRARWCKRGADFRTALLPREENAELPRLVDKPRGGTAVYSPQLHQDIARHRQADMLREAHRQRLANVAAAAKPNGPGKLARIGSVLSSIPLPRRSRVVGQRPAVGSAA
jgi:hypothetical protein